MWSWKNKPQQTNKETKHRLHTNIKHTAETQNKIKKIKLEDIPCKCEAC
jgi:hypothetical protein